MTEKIQNSYVLQYKLLLKMFFKHLPQGASSSLMLFLFSILVVYIQTVVQCGKDCRKVTGILMPGSETIDREQDPRHITVTSKEKRRQRLS